MIVVCVRIGVSVFLVMDGEASVVFVSGYISICAVSAIECFWCASWVIIVVRLLLVLLFIIVMWVVLMFSILVCEIV